MIRALLISVLLLSACVPEGALRLPIGQSAEIASAGTQLTALRAQNGVLRPVAHNAQLQAAAQSHADDLARTGGLSNLSSDGSTLADRIARANYGACFSAENTARGQTEIRAVMADWMASEAHRANILNAQVTQYGFARASDTWVLVLARPC